MIGDVVRVKYEMHAYNATRYQKEMLTHGDVFLVISEDGYTRAVRLKDTCVFNFSHNSFALFTQPFCEDV